MVESRIFWGIVAFCFLCMIFFEPIHDYFHPPAPIATTVQRTVMIDARNQTNITTTPIPVITIQPTPAPSLTLDDFGGGIRDDNGKYLTGWSGAMGTHKIDAGLILHRDNSYVWISEDADGGTNNYTRWYTVVTSNSTAG